MVLMLKGKVISAADVLMGAAAVVETNGKQDWGDVINVITCINSVVKNINIKNDSALKKHIYVLRDRGTFG